MLKRKDLEYVIGCVCVAQSILRYGGIHSGQMPRRSHSPMADAELAGFCSEGCPGGGATHENRGTEKALA